MTDDSPLHIPTPKELIKSVVSSVHKAETISDARPLPKPLSPPPAAPDKSFSFEAMAFLHHAALPENVGFMLEEHWNGLGIKSGSVKKRVLKELLGAGLIRLEKKGKACTVTLYAKAWELLGREPPRGMGTGGSMHKHIVLKLAQEFRSRGYDVHIEFPVGPDRKRVDLAAFGKCRLGIEVGLTDPKQEIWNLQADLRSGALDYVVFCSNSTSIFDKVRQGIQKDPWLSTQSHRIRFIQIKE